MSTQPPSGQGPWQQPPPGQGPPGPPPGSVGPPPPGPPPGPVGPPPPGPYPPGGYPPSGLPPMGPGGPPPYGPGEPPGRPRGPLLVGLVAVAVALVGLTVVLVLTVISSDDAGDDYCALLEDNQGAINNFSDPPPSEVDSWVTLIHDLRESAPDEVADDWEQIADPLAAFEQVLDAAGVSWDEYADAVRRDDLDPEITEAAQRFQTEYFSLDLSAIGQTLSDHAADACGLEIHP